MVYFTDKISKVIKKEPVKNASGACEHNIIEETHGMILLLHHFV